MNVRLFAFVAVIALHGGPTRADEKQDKKITEAIDSGIKYLKAAQSKTTPNWENDTLTLLQPGGSSCLALLAMLECGVKADDDSVARGLKYARSITPEHTYVVGLQTQVLCKANQKADAELIKRDVKWLEESAIKNKKGELAGWSYTANGGNRADNSNARYAVAGLLAAQRAGFKADKDTWTAIQKLYINTQVGDGSWSYQSAGAKGTHTMTLSGLFALAATKEALGVKDKGVNAAIARGTEWVDVNFVFVSSPHTYYNFDVIAAAGRAIDQKTFGSKDKKIDWYRDGADWLLTQQKPGGEWRDSGAIDTFPVVSTSFALRFLASNRSE